MKLRFNIWLWQAFLAIFVLLFGLVFCWNLAIFMAGINSWQHFLLIAAGVFVKSLVRVHQILPWVFIMSISYVIFDLLKSGQLFALKLFSYSFKSLVLPGLLGLMIFASFVTVVEHNIRPDFMLKSYAFFCQAQQVKYCQHEYNLWAFMPNAIAHATGSGNTLKAAEIIDQSKNTVTWFERPKYHNGHWLGLPFTISPKYIKYSLLSDKDRPKPYQLDFILLLSFIIATVFAYWSWQRAGNYLSC